MYEIKVTGALGEIHIALLKNNQLLDAALYYPDFPDQWHDSHQVRIVKNMPNLGGAFVLLDNGKEAFLTGFNKKTAPQEGSFVIAQVVRSPQNNKNIRLKLHPSPEQFSPLSLPRKAQKLSSGPTPLEEFAAYAPNAPIFYDNIAFAASIAPHLKPRLVRQKEAFDLHLQEEWEQLFESTLSLDNILIAHITPTAALISIDLDTASFNTPYKNDFERNLAAFPALLRQIRLRNLSGTILIDPAGVKTRKRPALLPFIEKLIKKEADPLSPSLSGITPSGLIEITRPHKRPSLYDLRTTPHGRALYILQTLLREKHSGTKTGDTLYSTIEIIDILQNNPHLLEDFALEYGHPLKLKTSTFHRNKFSAYFSLKNERDCVS